MDLRQLRYFLEIVDQGGVTRAAARLNISQSALSIHLRNMEERLGTALLTRHARGVNPTEAGEALARHARMMLQEQNKIEQEIRNLGRETAGEVRIGLPGTISEIVAVPLIEEIRRCYPGIRLTISEAMSGFVFDWLQDSRIDLAILYAAPTVSGMASVKLLDEELLVLAAPGCLAPGPVSFAALAGMKLILPSRPHGLRMILDAETRRREIYLEPAIEIDSYNNIKILVARSCGVSVLPTHAVAAECRRGILETAPLEAQGLRRSAYLVHHALRPMTRATAVVRDLILNLVTDLITRGDWAGAALAPHPGYIGGVWADAL